jgi:hypothetical protein
MIKNIRCRCYKTFFSSPMMLGQVKLVVVQLCEHEAETIRYSSVLIYQDIYTKLKDFMLR